MGFQEFPSGGGGGGLGDPHELYVPQSLLITTKMFSDIFQSLDGKG